jgi:N-terminal half of MaoC dehydratase
MTHLTPEILARVGVPGDRVSADYPVSADNIRRFVQAAMIQDPMHWDPAAARRRGFPGVVSPPLFPVHAVRLPPGASDPFDYLAENPDWDGFWLAGITPGLAPLDIALKRVLNGGTRACFYQLARVGDIVTSQSQYADISERTGPRGALVLAEIETEYTTQDDEILARVHMTLIYR